MHHGVSAQADRVAAPPAISANRGSLVSRYKDGDEYIRIDCEGVWTPAQVDWSFAELALLIETMRMQRNRVRVLVDRRETKAQCAATAERLLFHTQREYNREDRVAVLVDTSLDKLQCRQFLDERTHSIFLSENAAMTWLTAHD